MSVMLTSAVCNSKTDRDIHIYIIESGMDDSLRQKIETSVLQNKKSFQRVDFPLVEAGSISDRRSARCRKRDLMSPDTYSRILIPSLLPAEAEQLHLSRCRHGCARRLG